MVQRKSEKSKGIPVEWVIMCDTGRNKCIKFPGGFVWYPPKWIEKEWYKEKARSPRK